MKEGDGGTLNIAAALGNNKYPLYVGNSWLRILGRKSKSNALEAISVTLKIIFEITCELKHKLDQGVSSANT